MVHDRLLDAEHIDKFQTLILPNIAALSTKQNEQLTDYVNRGGSIVATHETSLYDEWGVRRNDFGLASLFGASFDGGVEGPMQNSYLNLEKDPANGRFHPLLSGFEDATRIINGAYRVKVKATDPGAYAPLTLIPSYPDLPMEEVFPPPLKTKEPAVFLRQVGRGRVVYFPFDLDRTFWEVLDVDHGKLLRNAVLWAAKDPQPVTIKGPGVLDISIWTQKDSMTVHLVNLTNPMMMKGPIRDVIPAPAQQVSIRIPEGKRVGKVHFLVANVEAPHRQANGQIELTVPSIGVHEVIAVDFA
jgi:hypothetical protein